jgi:hypothetical protein
MNSTAITRPKAGLHPAAASAPELVLDLQAVTKIYPGKPPVPALRG